MHCAALRNKEKVRNHFWALLNSQFASPPSNPGGGKGDVLESMIEEEKIC
jgi:hypothetical protein